MAPHELDESRDRERRPAPHAEPGEGHMDIQNARRLALLVIAGHQHQPRPRADEQQRQPQAEQPGGQRAGDCQKTGRIRIRSEEHTTELQSLMRISYAVFCLKKTTLTNTYQLSTNQKSDMTKRHK